MSKTKIRTVPNFYQGYHPAEFFHNRVRYMLSDNTLTVAPNYSDRCLEKYDNIYIEDLLISQDRGNEISNLKIRNIEILEGFLSLTFFKKIKKLDIERCVFNEIVVQNDLIIGEVSIEHFKREDIFCILNSLKNITIGTLYFTYIYLTKESNDLLRESFRNTQIKFRKCYSYEDNDFGLTVGRGNLNFISSHHGGYEKIL